jgi:hypothetical protein
VILFKKRLEDIQLFMLAQLHQRALACESQSKDTAKTVRHNVHMVDCDLSSPDDKPQEVYVAEMVWPKQAKTLTSYRSSHVQRNSKKKINLHLMSANVTKYLTSYLKATTLK